MGTLRPLYCCYNVSQTLHCKQSSFFAVLPDMDNFCKNKTDGIHAHPTDCTHFIECSNGYTYSIPCAPGSVFNPSISACDNANNVPSCQLPDSHSKNGHETQNNPQGKL